MLYELLTAAGVDRVDLVLSTRGGSVETARKLATVLRETLSGFRVLVADRARSAGTMLCLAADDVVMGPLAELGPIDPHATATPQPEQGPGMISSEDVRRFPEMAREWFGVDDADDALQTLALVAQRVFPTTLTSIYRFDQLMRQIARELLGYQLPEAADSEVDAIVERLLRMGHSHDYPLMRAEAERLGLRVRREPPGAERDLWALVRRLRAPLDPPGSSAIESPVALAAVGGEARLLVHHRDEGGDIRSTWEPADPSTDDGQAEEAIG